MVVGYVWVFEVVISMIFEVLMWSDGVCWRILCVVLLWEIRCHPPPPPPPTPYLDLLRRCLLPQMQTEVGMKVPVLR